jgi:hypothetical protein
VRQVNIQFAAFFGIIRHRRTGMLNACFYRIENITIDSLNGGSIDEDKHKQQQQNAQDRHRQLEGAQIRQDPPEQAPGGSEPTLQVGKLHISRQRLDFTTTGCGRPMFHLGRQPIDRLLPHQFREP